MGWPSRAPETFSPPADRRMLAKTEGLVGERCITTNTAAFRPAGSARTIVCNGSTPPADAPITIIFGTGSPDSRRTTGELAAALCEGQGLRLFPFDTCKLAFEMPISP